MLLASDDANKEFVNPKNPDRALKVTFYSRTEPHNYNERMNIEHQLCGDDPECVHLKDPRFKGKKFPLPETITSDWIHIEIPGRKDLDLHEPVREDHKKRFPVEWELYQGQVSEAEQVSGTKLADWGELNPHQIVSLQAQRFYSVEQIANCSDGQIQALGMNGPVLRQKARGFLLKSRENTEAAKLKAESDSKARELEELKASIPDMIAKAVQQAMSQAQPPAPLSPKKPGRPRKVKDGANAAPTSQSSAG